MEPVISLRNVTKRFGSVVAVDDVTIDVPRGRCYAWLGPNGCGKTTLIRMMLGLARASSGEIVVRGKPIPSHTREALSRVGGIVEEPRFYPYLTGQRNLEVWAAHQGADARAAIPAALERVRLSDRAGDKVGGYSLGMRQRLGVARALLNDPELLVLDEPTNGLDPAGLVEFREMIREFVDEGRSVFISSHILGEVEKMADDVAIIEKGKMLASGSVAHLLSGGTQAVGVRIDDPTRALPVLQALPFATDVRPVGTDGFEVVVADLTDDELRLTGRELFTAGIGVLELRPVRETLERRFLELTGRTAGELAHSPLGAPPAGPPVDGLAPPDPTTPPEAR